MNRIKLTLFSFFLMVLVPFTFFRCGKESIPPADLVFLDGDIFTLDEENPWVRDLVITGNTITAVFNSDGEADKYIGENTKVIDLKGAFVTPGIIDGHVHFGGAGALINDANLMTVSDEEGLKKEIGRVVELLEDGEWITDGLWGAYEQWALGDAGEPRSKRGRSWRPTRFMIDDLTANNPCLLCRFDRQEYLANTAALKAAGMDDGIYNGMVIGGDGKPTGLIERPSPAYEMMREAVKPKSHDRLLDENRAALKALREAGIVEVHDIERPDQTKRFIELQEKGDLTCRVWLRPDLSRVRNWGMRDSQWVFIQRQKKRTCGCAMERSKAISTGSWGHTALCFLSPTTTNPIITVTGAATLRMTPECWSATWIKCTI